MFGVIPVVFFWENGHKKRDNPICCCFFSGGMVVGMVVFKNKNLLLNFLKVEMVVSLPFFFNWAHFNEVFNVCPRFFNSIVSRPSSKKNLQQNPFRGKLVVPKPFWG